MRVHRNKNLRIRSPVETAATIIVYRRRKRRQKRALAKLQKGPNQNGNHSGTFTEDRTRSTHIFIRRGIAARITMKPNECVFRQNEFRWAAVTARGEKKGINLTRIKSPRS